MSILLSILTQGLIYSLMALGVYITYSILDFPDLSVDSTFPFGAAVTAAAIVAGVPAPLTLPLSFAAGALAGTGLIHVKLKIRDLLSGIIVMTGLYSINLMIAGNKANLPIYSQETIFENEMTASLSSRSYELTVAAILLILVVFVKIVMDLYLKTRSGLLLRAAGDNETPWRRIREPLKSSVWLWPTVWPPSPAAYSASSRASSISESAREPLLQGLQA